MTFLCTPYQNIILWTAKHQLDILIITWARKLVAIWYAYFWGPIKIDSTNLIKSILIYHKRNLCLFTLHNQLWNVEQCHVWIESCLERVCKTSSRIHIFDSIHVTLQSLKSGFSRILWIQLLQLLGRRRHTEKEMVFIAIVVR